jgi:hypothetical protein
MFQFWDGVQNPFGVDHKSLLVIWELNTLILQIFVYVCIFTILQALCLGLDFCAL